MEKLWTESELAEYLRQSTLTIRRNRTAAPHRHPPFRKVGASVRYVPSEVQRWLDSRTVNSLDTPAQTDSSHTPARHSGRPKKEESVRKTRNAGK